MSDTHSEQDPQGARELHTRAMEIADRAFIARRTGQYDEAYRLFQKAHGMEARAAELAKGDLSRTVLQNSAAALAENAENLRFCLPQNSDNGL